MNLARKTVSKSFKTNFYCFQKMFKFRVKSQPGLTRYKWDLDYENPVELSKLTHGTNAHELISKVPVIEVEDDVVACFGSGEFFYGHPVQYISVNTRNPEHPSTCKYCGLRYKKKSHH